MRKTSWFLPIAVFSVLCLNAQASKSASVNFEKEEGRVRVTIGDEYFGTYVYQDDKILRPYFCDLHAPGGTQVTRNHPPKEGIDRTDHATMHPGLWLAFGDISGSDFWRNKARVEHVRFVREPGSKNAGESRSGGFSVENRYVSEDGNEICREICRIAIHLNLCGYVIHWRSYFHSKDSDFYFGDQEEMGLGVRVHTPMAAANDGRILNSRGQKNEDEAWGKQADWCDYSGPVDGKWVGVTLIPSPSNFRKSWFHARDYGFVAANPFGRNAFTDGEKSKVTVEKGERFDLEYAILIHSSDSKGDIDLSKVYSRIRNLFEE